MSQEEQPSNKNKDGTKLIENKDESVAPMDIDTEAPSQTSHKTSPSLDNKKLSDTIKGTTLSESKQQQQQQSLVDINQLQLAHAAAALSGASDFPFLANFESTMNAVPASDTPTTSASTPTPLHAHTPQSQSQQEASRQQQQTKQHHSQLSSSPPPPPPPPPPQQQQQQLPTADLSQLPTELLKRELMNQKVRADNRERKKRWRQQNEERNKDNDLRCRVNKRAHKLFGKEESEHKKKWIEEEFLKRQQKRKDKERRKGLVDDSLGGHAEGALNTNNGLDLAALAQHLAPQQSLTNMTDASYLTLLCNNLGIPAAARNLLGNMTAGHAEAQNSEAHPQAIDNTNHPPTTTTNTTTTTTTTAESTPAPVEQVTVKEEKDHRASLQPFPFQILEILQQLQHYQPHHGSDQNGGESSTANNDFQLTQPFGHGLSGIGERPEEKLVALLATTIQHAATVAAAAAHVKGELLEDEVEGAKNELTALSSDHNSSSKDLTVTPTTENTNNDTMQDGLSQVNLNSNNAEFPMDAVLTLMQLNAGWRQ